MTHHHVQDTVPHRKACLELSESVCVSPTSDGFFVHFEPSDHGSRQIGHVTVGPGAWSQTGTFEDGNLTLHPSIAVRMPVDGREVELLHGWVRNGKWVPA